MCSDIAVNLCPLQLREWFANALTIVVHIGARIEVSESSLCAYAKLIDDLEKQLDDWKTGEGYI